MAGNGGNLNKPGAEKIDMDNLWIYGYSIANLQRFYAPQHDAMKQLKKKDIFSHKYPVSILLSLLLLLLFFLHNKIKIRIY